jgi:drug/metabolite transporter (DMT)-like permease
MHACMNFIEKVGLRRVFSHLLFYFNTIMFKSGPLVLACIFCVSGVLQPTIVEFLTLNGAFDKSTLLIVLPNYLGMSFAILTRYEVIATTLKYVVWCDMLMLGVVDIVSQGLCMIGLVYAGSSIYIIIYSSTTIWAALWSYFLLQKQLLGKQWIGILIVVFGLSITAYDDNTSSTVSKKSDDEMIGILLILFGSFTHALTWVLIEKWTKQRTNHRDTSNILDNNNDNNNINSSDDSASNSDSGVTGTSGDVAAPELVCSLMGVFGSLVYCTWQVVYTLPRWNNLVMAPIAARQGNLSTIMVAYLSLTLMGFLHAVSFYHLLGQLGSVATGVMKGVQSVAVMVLSHAAFCGVETSQCFTSYKGLSLVVVLFGVYFYMANTTNLPTHVTKRRNSYELIGDTNISREEEP